VNTALDIILQWKPVNPVTNGPQRSARITGMAVLKGSLNKTTADRKYAQSRINRPYQRGEPAVLAR